MSPISQTEFVELGHDCATYTPPGKEPDEFKTCRKCGLCRPRTGFTKPCKGVVRIELRKETP